MIELGKEVSIEYTVFLEDKTQVDSNIGKEPLTFRYGGKQILPALEEALTGLNIGDTKQIKLFPDNAYGTINPEAIKEVDAELIPKDFRYAGAMLVLPNDDEGDILIQVKQAGRDKVILDFNHPLAGKTLTFNVKVLRVD